MLLRNFSRLPKTSYFAFSQSFDRKNQRSNEDLVCGLMTRDLGRLAGGSHIQEIDKYAEIMFRSFIKMKKQKKNIFDSGTPVIEADVQDIIEKAEQYVVGNFLTSVSEMNQKNLRRLGLEFLQQLKALNQYLDSSKSQIEKSELIDAASFKILLQTVSKVNRGAVRWPNFILVENNIREIIRMNLLISDICSKSKLSTISKPLGNAVISLLSAQQCILDQLENYNEGGIMPNKENRQKLLEQLSDSHMKMIGILEDNKNIRTDIRGSLGVLQTAQNLSGGYIELTRTRLTEYIHKRIESDLKLYRTKRFNFGDLSWALSKLLANTDHEFEEDIQKIASFFVNEFFADFKARKDYSFFKFEDITRLSWAFSKIVQRDCYKIDKNALYDLSAIIIERLPTLSITQSDALSLAMLIESLSSCNLLTEEYSKILQEIIGERILKEGLNIKYSVTYLNIICSFISTKSDFTPKFIYFVKEYLKLDMMVNTTMVYVLTNALQFSMYTKIIENQRDAETNNSTIQLIQKVVIGMIENINRSSLHDLNYISLTKLYRFYVTFIKQRNPEIEEKILSKALMSKFDSVVVYIELEALAASIDQRMDFQGPNNADKILEMLNAPMEFANFVTSMDKGSFFRSIDTLSSLNYNIRSSKICSNITMHPNLKLYVQCVRMLIVELLKKIVETDSQVTELFTIHQIGRLSGFLQSFFMVERRISVETSAEDLKNYLVLLERVNLESACLLVSPLYGSSLNNVATLEKIEKLVHKCLINENDSVGLKQLNQLYNIVYKQRFFNLEYKELLEKVAIEKLTASDFNAESEANQVIELISYSFAFKDNIELIRLVSSACSTAIQSIIVRGIESMPISKMINSLYTFDRSFIIFEDCKDAEVLENVKAAKEAKQNLNEILEARLQTVKYSKPKTFLLSNLQEKTKETLDELGFEYVEEEYVEGFLCDFVIPDLHKVIEVMGPIHYIGETQEMDLRTQSKVHCLSRMGWNVICLRNSDIDLNIQDRQRVLLDKLGYGDAAQKLNRPGDSAAN